MCKRSINKTIFFYIQYAYVLAVAMTIIPGCSIVTINLKGLLLVNMK